MTSVAYSFDREAALQNVSSWLVGGSRHLPAIFTGLGILFTFLGLIVALQQDGLAAAAQGEKSLQSLNLPQLLNGVALAFRSSLAGVGASIVCTAVFRLLDTSIEQSASALREAALAEDRREAPGEVLKSSHGRLERMVELTEGQKKQIGQLGSDIKTAFEQALSEQLETRVGQPLRDMDEKLEQFTEAQVETHQEAMGAALETFQDEFADNLGDQFERLEASLERNVEWQEQMQEKLDRALEESEELIERLDEHERQLADITSTREDLLVRRTELERAREERVEQSLDHLGDSVDRLEASVDALESAKGDLSELNEGWNRLMSLVNSGTDELASSVDSLETAGERLEEGVSRTEQVMGEAPDQLEQSVERMQRQLEAGLGETFERFDEETAQIADRLSGTHIRIENALEELDGLVGDLQKTLERQVESIQQLVRLIHQREQLEEQSDEEPTVERP
ncbi:MAG: hypothetical protein ABEL76_17170 [Bradymonadaceae bacterium]